MAATLLSDLSRATDSNSDPLSGATWTFYVTGTSTPQAVYTSAALTTPHTNPVIADSGGRFPPIYLDDALVYRGVLAAGATLQDIDPINSSLASGLASSRGSAAIGFIAAGSGSVVRTVEEKLRAFVSANDKGASPSASAAVNTAAFAAASAEIEALGGGTLHVEPGIYTVGKQTLAGSGAGTSGTAGGTWGIAPDKIISIHDCPRHVEIVGYGVGFVTASGLKFGSFNPTSGAAHSATLPFTDSTYRASPYGGMIDVENNASVAIRGFGLDGNSAAQTIGGQFGDTGYQIPGDGIRAYGNGNLVIESVRSFNHPLDGLQIGFPGLTVTDNKAPVTLINCEFRGNARQGLSWVGGNSLTAIGCIFAQTGRTVNLGTGVALSSAPGAGVDVEAESSICRNGQFIECVFVDNTGVGYLSHSPADNEDMSFQRCIFIGTTNWSAWPNDPGLKYRDCLFIGAVTNVYNDAADAERSGQFSNCRFISDADLSPTGQAYVANYRTIEVNAANALFSDCAFSDGGNTGGLGGAFIQNARLRDCNFNLTGGGAHVVRGTTSGRTIITHPSGTIDTSGQVRRGPVIVNGTQFGVDAIADDASGASNQSTVNAVLAVLREAGLIDA